MEDNLVGPAAPGPSILCKYLPACLILPYPDYFPLPCPDLPTQRYFEDIPRVLKACRRWIKAEGPSQLAIQCFEVGGGHLRPEAKGVQQGVEVQHYIAPWCCERL